MTRAAFVAMLGGVATAWSLSAVSAAGRLTIIRATLHSRGEEGPPISSTYEYLPGELLYLSFRLSGYQVTKDKVDLRYQIVMTDPQGLLVIQPMAGAIGADVSDNDKDWLPKVAEIIPLPPQLPSGEFTIKLSAADEFAKASAVSEVKFRVKGRTIEPVDTLTIRNMRFFRGEQDRQPLDAAQYRAGDTVWGRFDIVGFQVADKNQFNVEYGIAVYRPSGKLLYSEPKAAGESDSPFYPKRLLEGVLSLNLSKDLSAGEYGVTITARDIASGKSVEAKTSFQVLPQVN